MKLRTVFMITLVVIVIMTSIGVFIEKLDANPEYPYASIMITGMKNNYTIHEPIAFSVIAEGYGSGCGDVRAIITKENDPQYQSTGWGSMPSCVSKPPLYHFKYGALSGNTRINQTGNYTLQVSFNDLITNYNATAGMRFSVTSPMTMYNDTVPTSVPVANTNFTINYTIAGNGKLLGANENLQAKSLVLSLKTSSNGTLTVSVPRALIDAKLPNGNDDKFYVLANGIEAIYEETKTSDAERVLTIPFDNGTNTIEIIGATLI